MGHEFARAQLEQIEVQGLHVLEAGHYPVDEGEPFGGLGAVLLGNALGREDKPGVGAYLERLEHLHGGEADVVERAAFPDPHEPARLRALLEGILDRGDVRAEQGDGQGIVARRGEAVKQGYVPADGVDLGVAHLL